MEIPSLFRILPLCTIEALLAIVKGTAVLQLLASGKPVIGAEGFLCKL